MKKRNLIPLAALLCALSIPSTVYAGDINSAEQGILDAISGTQEYNGEYYRVTDGYRAKVSDYLNRDDIDLGAQEVNDYLFQFYRNIPTGIASGYMEKVEQPEEAGDPAGGEAGASGGGDAAAGSAAVDAPGGDAAESSAGNDAPKDEEAGNQTSGEEQTKTAGDGGASAGSGDTGVAGMASLAGSAPQKDAQGNIIDNTTGSTQSGELEYTVVPMDGTMYVWDAETLEVHAKAYKDSEVIGTIALGDKVSITGGATTGWAEIDFEGQKGYVSAVYLRTDGYMKGQGVEVEEEEPEEETEEETAKETEAGREENPQESSDTGEAEVTAKDYSDAKAPEKQVNLGMIAAVIIVILLAASAAVVLVHRNKKR